MKPTFVLLALVLASCAAAPPPPVIATPRVIELHPLPPDPAEEPLPADLPPGDWVRPLDRGSCYDETGLHGGSNPCPNVDGILSSEAHAARDGYYRLRYRELRTFYEADRTTWSAQRELYEALHRQDAETIQRLQPSWFDRNALPLGIAAGFLLGAGGITAIVLSAR